MRRDDRRLATVMALSVGAIVAIVWWGKKAQAAQPAAQPSSAKPFPLPSFDWPPAPATPPSSSLPGIFIPPQVPPLFNPGVFD